MEDSLRWHSHECDALAPVPYSILLVRSVSKSPLIQYTRTDSWGWVTGLHLTVCATGKFNTWWSYWPCVGTDVSPDTSTVFAWNVQLLHIAITVKSLQTKPDWPIIDKYRRAKHQPSHDRGRKSHPNTWNHWQCGVRCSYRRQTVQRKGLRTSETDPRAVEAWLVAELFWVHGAGNDAGTTQHPDGEEENYSAHKNTFQVQETLNRVHSKTFRRK